MLSEEEIKKRSSNAGQIASRRNRSSGRLRMLVSLKRQRRATERGRRAIGEAMLLERRYKRNDETGAAKPGSDYSLHP